MELRLDGTALGASLFMQASNNDENLVTWYGVILWLREQGYPAARIKTVRGSDSYFNLFEYQYYVDLPDDQASFFLLRYA